MQHLALAANPLSMDWKGILADHFGHFAVRDVVNLGVATLVAAALAAMVAAYGVRLSRQQARSAALWAGLFAAGVGLVRSQLPLALALVAAVLLLRPSSSSNLDRRVLAGMLVIGLACGSGASVVGACLSILLIVLYRWVGSTSGAADEK